MLFKLYFICFNFVPALVHFANAILSDQPQNTEAVVGSSVTFICRTLDRYSVNWEHTPIGSKTPNDVYISMAIVRPYDTRISMKVNRTIGEYKLTIPSVQVEDAGRYECIDGAGHGDRQGAELVVLVSSLACQEDIDPNGVLGENDCGLEPESIEFRCTLHYSGNLSPSLNWRKTGGDLVIPKTITIDRVENQVTVLAVIKPQLEMNGSSYTCETSLSKYNWTSSKVRLLYVFNTSTIQSVNETIRVNCLANSSQPCTFKWIRLTTKANKVVLREQQSVIVDKPGSYHCVAECSLRGQKCTVLPAIVEFSDTGSIISSGYKRPLFLYSVAGLTTVIIIVISVWFSRKYIERKKGRSDFSSKLLLTSFPHVQGIAAVGKNLYIIHRKHKAVSVYRSDYPYDLRKEIKREEFSEPRDIAAYKSYVYITDAGNNNCVWKMEVNLPKRFTAFIRNIGSPFTISINANGDVLLAKNPRSIIIYNSQGQVSRLIQIEEGIRNIQHAVEIRDGAFIVSHGIKYQEHCNITLVSRDGKTIKKYTERCEQHLGSLSQPGHIAINETGSVYVADVESDKIIVLDEELNPIHAVPLLASSQPTRLCYKDGQLLVGESNGAVQFFGVAYLARLKLVSQVSVTNEEFPTDNEGSSLLQAHNQLAEN